LTFSAQKFRSVRLRPDWPTLEARRDDLAVHLRVAEALRAVEVRTRRDSCEQPTSPRRTRLAATTPAKAKATLRKMTVRDLTPQKTSAIKGSPESSRQRCY